jgi:hypothetical protein
LKREKVQKEAPERAALFPKDQKPEDPNAESLLAARSIEKLKR